MKADLHLHTTASDGRLEPAEIVSLAVKVGLDVIAVTDHDTVDGIAPALAAAEAFPSLTVIPGVEINTDVERGEVHVLGYFIQYTDHKLAVILRKLRSSRRERARKMVAKLDRLGMNIDWQRVCELAQGGSICRPHIAQALLEGGYVSSEKEAFEKYIGHGGPAYVERYKLLPVEAVKLIMEARGLAVLAHPADIDNLSELIPELKAAGLAGIEVYYRDYAPEVSNGLLKIAEQFSLIPTGGSDYHAFDDGSEVMIGEVLTPPQSLEQLYALANKHSLELLKHR
ncbi:MAG TPA: PHP domain-containing protein [Dehalococcoidia bacterium]|nr:PHP domain-containing protein [Dehalococcoidia bacterium]